MLKTLPVHPGLVPLRDHFFQDGQTCLVLDWVPGPTLRQFIRDRGPLSPAETVAIACRLLEGLHVLHRRGYIHGDLHGGNVLVTGDGGVKLIDFQHAVRKGPAGRARAIRKLSPVPRQLAPESRKGLLTDRSDLYGVGFLCAAMLLGRDPRPDEIESLAAAADRSVTGNAATGGTRAADPAKAPPADAAGGVAQDAPVPGTRALWSVIVRAMHQCPERRYPSARALAAALRRAASAASTCAAAPTPPAAPPPVWAGGPWPRRARCALGAGGRRAPAKRRGPSPSTCG